MADNPNTPGDEAAAPAASEAATSRFGWLRKLKPGVRGWVVVVVVASVAIHAGFVVYSHWPAAPAARPATEIPLGKYCFAMTSAAGSPLPKAEFSLYVTILSGLEEMGREKIDTHRFRIQQGVEQLLRKVHPGDFDDPTLGDLKNQLREVVDAAMQLRAVGDVVITDLRVTGGSPPAAGSPSSKTAHGAAPQPAEVSAGY